MSVSILLENFKALCNGCRLYCAVIDPRKDPEIYTRIKELPQRTACLNKNIDKVSEENRHLYPYLVELHDDEFSHWLFEAGWGKQWSVFVAADASFPLLRNHLANILNVTQSTDKAPNDLPHYNPIVLQQYLTESNDKQLRKMFKYVTYYWLEKENGKPVYFYYNPSIKANQNKTLITDPPIAANLPLAFETLPIEPAPIQPG